MVGIAELQARHTRHIQPMRMQRVREDFAQTQRYRAKPVDRQQQKSTVEQFHEFLISQMEEPDDVAAASVSDAVDMS